MEVRNCQINSNLSVDNSKRGWYISVNMMTFEEFEAFYKEKGRCPNDIQPRSKPLNDKQLRRRYNQYVRSVERKEEREKGYLEPDELWEQVRQEVTHRDGLRCVLFDQLTIEEAEEISPLDDFDPSLVDPAHVLPRSTHPHLIYDPENIVMLSRLFHSRLDTYRNPLTGSPISKDEHRKWWDRIAGRERIERLYNKGVRENA